MIKKPCFASEQAFFTHRPVHADLQLLLPLRLNSCIIVAHKPFAMSAKINIFARDRLHSATGKHAFIAPVWAVLLC